MPAGGRHRPEIAGRLRRRLPLGRILFAPFVFRRRDVERVANISYGDAGKRNLLDVYRTAPVRRAARRSSTCTAERSAAAGRTARRGRSSTGSRARAGCASARTTASARPRRFPDHLVDVEEGDRLGARARPRVRRRPGDGVRGGQLRRRPPGVDGRAHAERPRLPARLRGAPTRRSPPPSALYGYYGRVASDDALPSSPMAYVRRGCAAVLRRARRPRHAGARRGRAAFVEQLPEHARRNPVVYAELPGGAALVRPVPLDPLRDGRRRRSRPSPPG